MINSVKKNFGDDKLVRIVEHDLQDPLPELGYFDAIISSFAIHHLTHQRKYSIQKSFLHFDQEVFSVT